MTVNTLGGDVTTGRPRSAAWLWPLVPIALTTFALAALVSFHVAPDRPVQSPPQHIIYGIYHSLGFVPAFLFFLLVLAWSSVWFITGRLERPGVRLLHVCGLTLAMAIWLNLRAEAGEAPPHAGVVGAFVGSRLVSALGFVPSTLLLLPLTLAALLLATDFFFYRYFEGLGAPAAPARRKQVEAGVEAGVEDYVTEHFKALSKEIQSTEIQSAEISRRAEHGPAVLPRPAAGPEPGMRSSHYDRRRTGRAYEPEEGGSEADRVAAEAAAEQEAREWVAEAAADARAGATGEDRGSEQDNDEDEFSIAAAVLDDEPDETDGAEPDAAETDATETDDTGAEAAEADRGEIQVAKAGDTEAEHGDDATPDETEATGSDRIEEPAEETDDIPRRGRLAPLVEDPAAGEEATAGATAEAADVTAWSMAPGEADDSYDSAAAEPAADAEAQEPVVPIPRPPEGVRQQRLFVTGVDEGIVREAIELVTSSRRASATFLQRQLRIDFDQAMELLDVLARRGVIERNEGETQGRVR